jgi:hypothetical protein
LYGYAHTLFNDTLPRFDTLGNKGPTALNESELGTGLQQTLFDIYAETSFGCPAAWLSEAFSSSGSKESWKYQYSVTPAYHGADLSAYFAVNATTPTAGFRHAFQKIWGNFIINNTPVISVRDATANASNATVPVSNNGKDINWPMYTCSEPIQMDLNSTGGTLQQVVVTSNLTYDLRFDPGVVNVFSLVNAYKWEAGRGERCEFWRKVGKLIPA